MSQPRPLFVTGTARSGSTLLARVLTAHRDVMVASDPYLPLFRSLRNAIVREAMSDEPTLAFDPSAPFQDYYFSRERLQVMDVIQAGGLDISFDRHEWSHLAQAIRTRASHECPDLVPFVDDLPAATYKGVYDRALSIISRARDCSARGWVGIKEVWIIEFFRALAKAYPEAKFVVLVRDPRATIASMLTLAAKDSSQLAHPLSFARHWRKYVAFTLHYQKDPLFEKRLHVLHYEELVKTPARTAHELCAFLEIDFDQSMLDPSRFADFTTGVAWLGNSSYESSLRTIDSDIAGRWRTRLRPEIVRFVDFVCGPEMAFSGYEPAEPSDASRPAKEILEYIVETNTGDFNWRSDFNDPALDYGFELFRRALLDLRDVPGDSSLGRRSFLFEDVFLEMLSGAAVRERN